MRFLPFLFEHVDFPSILAGHGYDVGTDPRGEPSGNGEEGGISMFWILAVLLLTLVTVGALVSLNPSSARARLRTLGPIALVLVLIAAPLVAWTATSGAEEKSLMVERWATDDGTPELIFSLGDDDVNVLETTGGKRAVRLVCLGSEGQTVLDAEEEWPFRYVDERGYEYTHAHHEASLEQVQRADRCRVNGTSVRLEADVEGVLTP